MAWVQVVIAIVVMIVGELLRPKPKIANAKPSALGDFNFPTADATRVIPFFVGTCKFRGMNTAWYGDLRVEAQTKKVKTGLWSSQRITTGHKYYLGVQMVAGYGEADALVGFQIDDKNVPFRALAVTTTQTGTVFNIPIYRTGHAVAAPVDQGDYWEFMIDEPALLDATSDVPSGVKGKVRIYKGKNTQPQDAYLAAEWGEPEIPAFRPLVHMVLESFYVGNSDTPPVFAPILRRCPNSLGVTGGKHNINGDANIACVAYMIMTDMMYGLKIPTDKINTASFLDGANTLHAEGLGISMQFDTSRSGKEWLGEVLRYADAVVFPDPETGLYTFKLARADYDIETLELYDDYDIEAESFEFTRSSWEETKNNIIVNYTDRDADYTVKPAQYQDLANIMARNNVIDSEQIDFLGLSHFASANVVATRVGKVFASPLARCAFKTGRKGYKLRPGSVFKLSKPSHGLSAVVMRVGDIAYGTLDNPFVQITCTEDVFAIKDVSYTAPAATGWVPPLGPPLALNAQYSTEAPHFLVQSEGRYALTFAARTGAQDMGYEAWSDPSGGTGFSLSNRVTEFTPTGVLRVAYPASTAAVDVTGFALDSTVGFEFAQSSTEREFYAGESLALIKSAAGEEWIAWAVVETDGAGHRLKHVMRGVFDTVPLAHEAGARVWVVSAGMGSLSETPYPANGTVSAKLLPFNPRGTLDIGSATTLYTTLAQRAWKPYPPAGLTVDGSATVTNVSGNATVAWKIRHRLLQDAAGVVVAQDAADYAAAPEGTYELKVYVGGALKRTVAISAAPWTTYDYTPAMRIADDADVTKTVKFGVRAINGAYSSIERMTHEVWLLDALNPLTITTTSLPAAQQGVAYNQQLAATGGATPYTWTKTAGTWPAGLSMSSSGLISGTPTAAEESQTVTVQVEGPVGFTDTQVLLVTVSGDCADYTIPAATGVVYNITEAEEALPPTGNTVHICNTITNPVGITFDDFSTNSLGSYTEFADSAANWAISAGHLTASTGAQAVLTRNGVSFADGEVSCVITESHDAGLVLRLVDNNNYYVLVVNDSLSTPTPNRVIIYKRVGGTYTQVGASAGVAFNRGTPHTVTFSAVGTALTAKFDGTTVISTTDSSHTSGGCGPRTHGGVAKFDNFNWP